jgi:hypothetical protein
VVNPGAGRNPAMANLGDRVADLEVKTIVIDRLARAPELRDKRLTVQVARQVVTLEGTVDSPAQKRAAEDIALQVPGVQNLVSQLIVADGQSAPESPDERLARRVEFELYSTKAVSLKTVQIRSQDGTRGAERLGSIARREAAGREGGPVRGRREEGRQQPQRAGTRGGLDGRWR